jgi:putative flippase GtrA
MSPAPPFMQSRLPLPASIVAVLLKRRTFVLYSLIGISGASLDLLAFYLLVSYIGVSPQLANCISVSLGICNNFCWNAWLNFKVPDKLFRRFISFYLVGLVGLAISAICLYIGTNWLGFSPTPVKVASIVLVVLTQYNFNRILSFRATSIHD